MFEDVYSSSTNEDPYLKQLIQKEDGNEDILTIYTTDQLLYAILTLKYSVYPWDMIVHKKGNAIIFDKNDENKKKLTYLEMQCINENTSADMPEDEKVILNQCEESSIAAGNWHLFSTKEQPTGEEHPLPENLKENKDFHYPTDFAFKYVKCRLRERIEARSKGEEPKAGEPKMNVVVKSRVDALNSDDEQILVKCLNECDNSTNWRQQLEKSAGQLTSALYSANTNNLAKWLLQA